jgi:hypothetical protein
MAIYVFLTQKASFVTKKCDGIAGDSARPAISMAYTAIRQNQSFPERFVRGMIVKGMGRRICKIIPLTIIPLTLPAFSMPYPRSSVWLRFCCAVFLRAIPIGFFRLMPLENLLW